MEKKIKYLVGLLIAFILLTLFLGGYLIYDKVMKQDNNSNKIIDREKPDLGNNIKIDKEKDYVYKAKYSTKNKNTEYKESNEKYEEITYDYTGFSIKTTKGIQYLANLEVPYINIDSIDAKETNEKIKELYLNMTAIFDKNLKEEYKEDLRCKQVLTYEKYKYNNILSIVVINGDECTSPWLFSFDTYNFDLTNGKLLTYENMLSKLDYDKDYVQNKMKTLINKKMTKLYPNMLTQKDYDLAYKVFDNILENDNVTFFVNDKGRLNILTIPYYEGVQYGDEQMYLFEIEKKEK